MQWSGTDTIRSHWETDRMAYGIFFHIFSRYWYVYSLELFDCWTILLVKLKSEMRSFKNNENIHKKEGGSYYVVSANKASSVTL